MNVHTPPALCAADEYVEITLHFRCNLACTHCMIEGTMDWLQPQSDAQYQALLEENRRRHRWKGITLTGAEITLRADLPRLATAARAAGFEHVRIQTHGMKLADAAYCRSLVDAGIDEYFISLTAADAATHDAITGTPGSFRRTLAGMENLSAMAGVSILTNTVITRLSYRQLAAVVQLLAPIAGVRQMEFWTYWPMRETDTKDLIVSHLETLPYLRAAIAAAQRLGRRVEVKNFPQCLLGEARQAVDNSQPELVIDPAFWPEFMRNGFHNCVHRARCASRTCLGLNTAYVSKFGWHADTLSPLGSEA